jgi:two-component system sensor histidine kinase/response regulator
MILMLTSADQPSDVARCEELHIAAHLMKPVKQSELLDAIMLALGLAASDHEDLAAIVSQRGRPLAPLRILLAEDSLVNQKLATGPVGGPGPPDRGRRQRAGGPGGAELPAPSTSCSWTCKCRRWTGWRPRPRSARRRRSLGGHVPIVAMTAHAMKGDRELCLAAGMDEYIAKPIRAHQLFDVIEAVVSPAQTAAPAPAPKEIIDWAESLRSVQGDQRLLRALVEAALKEIPGLLAAAAQAVAQSDAPKLRLSAHTLRGSLRCFGETPVISPLQQLETMGQDRNLADAAVALVTLEEEMAQIIAAMERYLGSAGGGQPA